MYDEIEATVIIKSPNDSSSYRGQLSHEKAGVGDYLPDLDTIIHTARYFRDNGFKVFPSQNCLRLKGAVEQFENMFGVCLHVNAGVACIGNVRVPELLNNILVRIIFPGALAQAS